ncbi:hypothetical protein [Pseudonocardia spinosispora]|uniref:hypothetical protein n=1 Tax=Pseudonocardia spinosispora TaxID=103441 RepID=UPI0012EBC31A|nr:hypothetical protein [Pseudonocardia spinosispora]
MTNPPGQDPPYVPNQGQPPAGGGYPPPQGQPFGPGYPAYPPPTGHPAPHGHPGAYPPPPGYPSPPSYPRPQGYGAPQGYGPAQGYPPYAGPGGWAPPPNDPLIPGDFSGWFSRVMSVTGQNFGRLALLQVIAAVVLSILVAILGLLSGLGDSGMGYDTSGGGLTREFDPSAEAPSLAGMMASSILFGLAYLVCMFAVLAPTFVASVYLVVRNAAGESAAIPDALRFAGRRAGPAIGWGLLVGFLIALGCFLFFLPGIYLGTVLGGSWIGVVALERKGIGRCFTLVNPRFFPTLGRMAVYGVLSFVVFWGIFIVMQLLNQGSGSVLSFVLSIVVGVPVAVLGTAMLVVTYAELRGREQGGLSTATLAQELNR